MKKQLIAIVFATLMIATAFAMLVTISPSPVNNGNPVGVPDATTLPPYNITINLTNSQSTATPKDFQQLLKMDWKEFAGYLNTNVSNVRIYNSTTFSASTELSAWIETDNTITATSSNVWVNLSGTIVPAGGSVSIYMVFLATTASWSSHWGLAPQLSTKYGQFDNGANVFTNYWNFAGTTLPTGWSGSGETVNNGIYTNVSGDYASYSFSTAKDAPFVLDYYGYNKGTASYSEIGMDNPPTRSAIIEFQYSGAGPEFLAYNDVASSTVSVSSLSALGIYTIEYISTSSAVATINYGTQYSLTADIPTSIPAVGMYNDNGQAMFVQWMRTRLYAPDGVMPSMTINTPTPTLTGKYVSIALVNNQTTATSVNFPQLLKIDWSKYASYLNSEVSNVRFYNSTDFTASHELSGWIQTNNTTTATSSDVWVNLSGTIVPASGSVDIYMAFATEQFSWSSHWGLNPLLSTVYGAVDNGIHVFNFYDNFAGTTLNTTKWQIVETGTYSVNNAITLLLAAGDTYTNLLSKNTFTYPMIVGGSYNLNYVSSIMGYDGPGEALTTTAAPGSDYGPGLESGYYLQFSTSDATQGLQVINSAGTSTSLTTYTQSLPATVGFGWQSTGAEYGYVGNNIVTSSTDTTNTIANYYLYAGGTGGTGAGNLTIHYFYGRNAPPDNVMPSAIAGLTTYKVTFVSNFPYDHAWNISIGTTNNIVTTNTTQFTLSNGTYTYNASVSQPSSGDMYHIKNLTGTFTVNGSNLTISLNFVTPIHSFAIPIKLYNNQTTSVVENTPILIHVDWAKYFPYIFDNVSDIRFYTNNEHFYTIYELPAWLQSGNSYLDTNSSVWINLEAESIAAHSSIVIYMYINGSNTWSKYWGESPLLSSTYAKHDNGANVFQVYWNFAGTSMSGWNKDGSGTGASSSMDNGLQQSVIDSSLTQTVAVNTTAFTKSYIFDVNLSYTGASDSNDTYLAILTGSDVGYYSTEPFGFTSSGIAVYWNEGTSEWGALTSDGGIGTIADQGLGGNGYIGKTSSETGLYWSSTQYLYHNYNEVLATTVGGTPPSTYYIGFSMSNNQFSTSTANQTIHYLDGRIAPPNNTLPAYQIEPANVSTIQFNETGLPSGQAWSVTVNGVITTSTSSTITVFVDTGTYNYTTNTSNDVDFKILPNSGSINVSAFTDYYVNIDYINISYPVVFYQNTLISGVSWSVWLNNTTVQKELSSTGNTVTFYATNGTYTYYVMTPVFDAVTFTVSPQTAGIGVDGPSFTYLTNITFTYSAYEVVFSQNGLIYPQSWSLVINGTTYNSNPSEQVIFWGNAHKNYSASINSPTLQIHPEQKTYNFTLNASLSYTVDFVIDVTIVESGYTGEWHADVNNVEYSSTTNTIVAEVVPGYVSISIWITDTGYTITPAQTVYSNALAPFTLNVSFSQTPTNYVTAIFGNLTFIYLIVFIGIAIFAAVLVMKLRRR